MRLNSISKRGIFRHIGQSHESWRLEVKRRALRKRWYMVYINCQSSHINHPDSINSYKVLWNLYHLRVRLGSVRSSFDSVHPILPNGRQRLGIIRPETIPRMRLVEMSHDLLITRLDQSSEIFSEFIPFSCILLGQFSSNKGTLSSQESSSLT
jgi:hypothetical protein